MNIDFSKPAGAFRRIHGVNSGPVCLNGAIDLSEAHRRAGFPTVRVHDTAYYFANACDIPCVFPLFHLDAGDPRNYRFARTDAYLKSIIDCGSRIVYQLGLSYQCNPAYRFDIEPPADYDKWADIVIGLIRHCNDGWADGFRHGIEYWEIWNEPENGGEASWNAPFAEYVRFYIQVAKRIKNACPGVKLGGPALCGYIVYNQDLVHTFLKAVQAAGAPLDFFSWHAYPERPGQMAATARVVRNLLDQYGFQKAESHLNEWNLAPYRGEWRLYLKGGPAHEAEYIARKKGPECAAMAASGLIALQDVPIDMTNFYEAANGIFGLFELSGVPGKPYYAFVAFRDLLDLTPERVHVEGSDPDNGLALLAGRAVDGETLQILASNFQAPRADFSIALQGLPQGATWRVSHRRLDAHANLECLVDYAVAPSKGPLLLKAPPRSVHLLSLRRERPTPAGRPTMRPA
jgi:hypothetical protein